MNDALLTICTFRPLELCGIKQLRLAQHIFMQQLQLFWKLLLPMKSWRHSIDFTCYMFWSTLFIWVIENFISSLSYQALSLCFIPVRAMVDPRTLGRKAGDLGPDGTFRTMGNLKICMILDGVRKPENPKQLHKMSESFTWKRISVIICLVCISGHIDDNLTRQRQTDCRFLYRWI